MSLGAKVVVVLVPGRAALGGLCPGLHFASHGRVCAAASDMPWLSPAAIRVVLDQALSGLTMSPDRAWSRTTRIAAGESHGMSLAAAQTRPCEAKCRPGHSPPRAARPGTRTTTTFAPSDITGAGASPAFGGPAGGGPTLPR